MSRFVQSYLALICIAFSLNACCGEGTACKFNDSSAQDRFAGGSAVNDPDASILFHPAQAALKTNCVQCHASFGGFTEAEWISSGYIVVGQPNDSLVFQKIRGANSGGPENMPPGLTLSTKEILAIRAWITGIGSGSTPGPAAPSTPADQRLQLALTVLNRASTVSGKSCVSCHSVPLNSTFYPNQVVPAFGTFYRDAQFVTSQLLIQGSPSTSWLFRSLRGYGGDIATMPKEDTHPISSMDANVLSDWITQIGN